MTCPMCGAENQSSAQHCNCGYEFVPVSNPRETNEALPQGKWCPKCKTFNPATNKFCGKCGEPMVKKTSPIAIGCLGLIGIVVLIDLFSGGKTNKTTDGVVKKFV